MAHVYILKVVRGDDCWIFPCESPEAAERVFLRFCQSEGCDPNDTPRETIRQTLFTGHDLDDDECPECDVTDEEEEAAMTFHRRFCSVCYDGLSDCDCDIGEDHDGKALCRMCAWNVDPTPR